MSAAARDLEDALDELYAAAPDEFVLVRSRLERELKGTGDTEAVNEVHRRRRPHLAAWATNQLARRNGDDLAELLEVTARVAQAQHGALGGGGGDDLRELARERNEILDRLTADGVHLLRGHAPKPDSYRDNIAATLDAASLDPARSDELRAGRLSHPLAPPAGFGPDPAGPIVAALSRGRDVQKARDKAQQELTKARKRAAALADARDDARAEQASAEIEVESAAAHARDVEQALERANASLEQATTRSRAARERAESAERETATSAADVREAEARLKELERD